MAKYVDYYSTVKSVSEGERERDRVTTYITRNAPDAEHA